jgi:hypothetical protein
MFLGQLLLISASVLGPFPNVPSLTEPCSQLASPILAHRIRPKSWELYDLEAVRRCLLRLSLVFDLYTVFDGDRATSNANLIKKNMPTFT